VSKLGIASVSVIAALALASGCGGGSSETASRVERAAFLRQADAICRASSKRIVNRSLAALSQGAAAGRSRHEIETAAVASVLIPALRAEVRDLGQLPVPPGDQRRIEAILVAIEGAVDEAEADPQSYVQAGGHYRPGSYHYGDAKRLATRYGLADCPQG
jgi:hypothetical protein